MTIVTEAEVKKDNRVQKNSLHEFTHGDENSMERYIDVSILGNDHHMKLIQVIDIITHHKLGKYLKITNCAFLHYCNNDILAIDIRKHPDDVEKVTVVIADVLYEEEKKSILLGFVINGFEEFCERISFSNFNESVVTNKKKIIPAVWWNKNK